MTGDPGPRAGSARLADAGWLVGRWIGTGLGGRAEELWLAEDGGTMLGVFRLRSETLAFYELMTLTAVSGSLVLELKHFGPDLIGWEERAEVVSFPLLDHRGGTLFFDGLTYERTDDDSMTVYVAVRHDDGRVEELDFELRRARVGESGSGG